MRCAGGSSITFGDVSISRQEDPKEAIDESALVDWHGLICQLCKRKLKDQLTLQKHVDESELHRNNLKVWREANAPAPSVEVAVNPLARGGATRLWALKPGESRELPPPSVSAPTLPPGLEIW